MAAIKLALWMGCKDIALVGRDLALSGTKLYATGSADGGAALIPSADGNTVSFERFASKVNLAPTGQEDRYRQRVKNMSRKRLPVAGYYGGTAFTTEELLPQLRALESTIARSQGAFRIINATEGGAFVQGAEHISLEQTMNRWSSRHAPDSGSDSTPPTGFVDLLTHALDAHTAAHPERSSVIKRIVGGALVPHPRGSGKGHRGTSRA